MPKMCFVACQIIFITNEEWEIEIMIKLYKFVTCVSLSLLLITGCSSSVEDAIEARSKGKIDQAEKILQNLASNKNPEAQFELGKLYIDEKK